MEAYEFSLNEYLCIRPPPTEEGQKKKEQSSNSCSHEKPKKKIRTFFFMVYVVRLDQSECIFCWDFDVKSTASFFFFFLE